MVVVVKRPPSPGDTRGASRQAQTSSQRGNRRAACVCGRWPEYYPRMVKILETFENVQLATVLGNNVKLVSLWGRNSTNVLRRVF